MKKLSKIGEFGFIEFIAKKCRYKKSIIKGIGDDTAVVEFNKDKFLLYTADMLIEDVHFKRCASALAIGHKAIASSISDIAAMGGIPQYALISLGLPKNLNFSFAEKIYQGMLNTAKRFKVQIIGGDTNASSKIIIDVFLTGYVERKYCTFRSQAKIDDDIFVSGQLGGSLYAKHLKFIPRLTESRFLVKNFKINAMIDISDGLLQDLNHILQSSRVGAIIYSQHIPRAKKARNIASAYYDGEDFELLFTLPNKYSNKLLASWPFKHKLAISRIGKIVNKKHGLLIQDIQGKINKPVIGGYQHFD